MTQAKSEYGNQPTADPLIQSVAPGFESIAGADAGGLWFVD